MNRLAIGSAQFGLPYGIANTRGQVPPGEVADIVAFAGSQGVCDWDTAAGYGDAEACLGEALEGRGGQRIVTKLPAIAGLPAAAAAESLRASLQRSLRNLGVPSLHGLLVHDHRDLQGPLAGVLTEFLEEVIEEGLATRTGVSVYSPEDLESVMEVFSPGIVQGPVNILDQRLVRSPVIARLREGGCEFHARSVFLQGVLLMPAANLPDYLQGLREPLSALHRAQIEHGVEPLPACLAYVSQLREVDCIVVGVDSERQLREICAALARAPLECDWLAHALDDRELLEPRCWNRGRG